jgi:hypothetical protein
MEMMRVQWRENWRTVFEPRYKGSDLAIKSDPILSGGTSLAKRAAINRATLATAGRVRDFLCDRADAESVADVIECSAVPARFLVRPVNYGHMEWRG